MSELQPCPFCGSVRVTKAHNYFAYWVECGSCEATGPVCGGHEEDGDRSDDAIDAWNKAPRPTVEPRGVQCNACGRWLTGDGPFDHRCDAPNNEESFDE